MPFEKLQIVALIRDITICCIEKMKRLSVACYSFKEGFFMHKANTEFLQAYDFSYYSHIINVDTLHVC